MKARIADELLRDDLTSQIGYAITEAIEFFQPERFYFNESDGITFITLTSNTIPYLYDIDKVYVLIGNNNYTLRKVTPEEWRILMDAGTTGQPCDWVYFQEELRLYPIPDQEYTIRIQAHYKVSAPANDSETANRWMTDAEAMIRHYAKGLLNRDVIYDADKAALSFSAAQDAFQRLKGITNKMNRSGFIRPTEF